MNSKIVFGQYYHSDSLFHKMDPRLKIVCLFLVMITIFLINNLAILGGFLVFILTLIKISKVPFSKFLNSLKFIFIMLIFTVVFQLLFNTGGALIVDVDFNLTYINLSIIIVLFILYFLSKKIIKKYRFLLFLVVLVIAFVIQYYLNFGVSIVDYNISIYEQGFLISAKIILRIVCLIFISSLLTLTTKPTDLNNGLESLFMPLKIIKVNTSILAMMISIALRFIPTLINEADKILKAQASRGVDFSEGRLKDKITQIIALLIPMFVIAYKRAEDLAYAMEARGYIPGEKRSRLNELKYKASDWIMFSFCIVLLGVFIYLKVEYKI